MDIGENSWERRCGLNVETIQRCAPDLIGFQELQTSNQLDGNLGTYREQMPEYQYYLGPICGTEPPYAYVSIFWNPSRLKLIKTGGFWLSHTPEKYSFGWDATSVRCVSWASFRLLPDGPDFLHLNTHLDQLGYLSRLESVKLILQQLHQLGGKETPAIITGDFNTNPESQVHAILEDDGFVDTFTAAGLIDDDDDAFTYHEFKGTRHPVNGRIDWILVRDGSAKFKVKSSHIIRYAKPPLYPSDHFPVMSEISLNP